MYNVFLMNSSNFKACQIGVNEKILFHYTASGEKRQKVEHGAPPHLHNNIKLRSMGISVSITNTTQSQTECLHKPDREKW